MGFLGLFRKTHSCFLVHMIPHKIKIVGIPWINYLHCLSLQTIVQSWLLIKLTVPAFAPYKNLEQGFKGTCWQPPRRIFFVIGIPCKNVVGILVVARKIVHAQRCQWCFSSFFFFFLHIHHSTVWVHASKVAPIKFDETKMF